MWTGFRKKKTKQTKTLQGRKNIVEGGRVTAYKIMAGIENMNREHLPSLVMERLGDIK